jgi:hypothetical protein
MGKAKAISHRAFADTVPADGDGHGANGHGSHAAIGSGHEPEE